MVIEKDKREKILRVTLALIVEKGLESTPMSLIAKEARVGMGTIYHYFETKEVLVNLLYKNLKQNVNQAMFRNYLENDPIRQRFFTLWRNSFHHYLNHPKAFLFLEQYSFSPYITPETKAEGAKAWEKVAELFREAQQQQIMKEMPLKPLMFIATGPLLSLVKMHISSYIELNDAVIETSITACWDAVKR